jgi:subtilisin
MKTLRTAFTTAIAAAALLLLLAPGASTEAAPGSGVLVDVIIGFDSAPGASEEALVRGLGGQIAHRYSIVPGMAASVPESAIAALRNNPNVAAVDLDGEVQAIVTELENSWGVQHIGSGDVHAASNTGLGISIAVIDTGIGDGSAAPHEDLSVVGGYDFVDGDGVPQDGYGHGTHVAGTACALDNGFGVVGVAPDCDLYNLRVLNNSGGGSWSDILAAIDYTVANEIDVANLSLGGSNYPGSTVEAGFASAADSGVIIVAAAGNSGNKGGNNDSVSYPARFDSVIAVAATDQNDKRASFSSTGPDLEISAPGVSVNSTVPSGSCTMCTDSGYRTASGTSMASPHVAGVAALMIAAGVSDVRGQLSATAIPLGSATKYGAGLVDAPGAVGLGDVPATTGSVTGTVTDALDSMPISGASISTDTGQSTTTASDGTYTLADVPTGTRTVTAAAAGYDSADQIVEVAENTTIVVDFALTAPPTGSISGTVTTADDGTAIAEATVSTDTGESTTAGTDGSYILLDVPTGTRTVTVSADGFVSASQDVAVTDGADTTADHTLVSAPTPGALEVTSIVYTTTGGGRHLVISVSVGDENGPVEGVTVAVTVYLDGKLYGSATATTDTEGRAGFRAKNAPSGAYTTNVTSLNGVDYVGEPDPGFEK